MAGTIQKVRLTGKPGSDINALALAVNQLIADFDAHTHKTPTAAEDYTSTPTSDAGGAGSTGGTSGLTTAGKIAGINGSLNGSTVS